MGLRRGCERIWDMEENKGGRKDLGVENISVRNPTEIFVSVIVYSNFMTHIEKAIGIFNLKWNFFIFT